MVGFDDIPAFFCPSTFGGLRAMRRVSMPKERHACRDIAGRYSSSGRIRRVFADFPGQARRLPRVFLRFEAARLPDRRARHISFSFEAAFFAKNASRAGAVGAVFRAIARICHEKGAEKLWRKNKDCATARKTPRREAGRGRVEDGTALSSTPNEHRAEALNCSGRRPGEHTR